MEFALCGAQFYGFGQQHGTYIRPTTYRGGVYHTPSALQGQPFPPALPLATPNLSSVSSLAFSGTLYKWKHTMDRLQFINYSLNLLTYFC